MLLLVAGTGLLVGMALSTVTGKQLLSSWIVARVNQNLTGRLAVHRLETLNLSEIVLAGLSLRTLAGDEVVAVERVRLDLELWPLLHGRVVLDALIIENAAVDLRFPNDREHGLLPALANPTREERAGAAPPEVRVEHLALRGIEVRLPETSTSGSLVLGDLGLDAKVALGSRSVVDVDWLRAEVWRDQAKLGGLTLHAALNDAGRPSRIELECLVADADVRLGITGTYTKQDDLRRLPIELELRLSEVTAEKITRALGKPGASQVFRGSVNAELRAVGSLADLSATAALTTRGGVVSITSRLQNLTELDLTLRTDRLRLAELFVGAPALALTMSASAHAKPLGARPFSALELRSASALDGTPLPGLRLYAERVGDELRAIDLRLEDAKSSIRLNGTASLSGESQLALDANLDGASILRLSSALGKPLPHTSARLRGTWSWVRRASGQVTGRGVLRGTGTFLREPWRLEMLPADISETGLILPRVALTYAGQSLTLRGRYSPAASDLELVLAEVDLRRLLQPFDSVSDLQGRSSARLLARGSLERPLLRFQVEGDGIRRASGPALDVRMTGQLDAQAGNFELEGDVHEHTSQGKGGVKQLSLVLDLRSRFEPDADFRRSWLRGEHQVKLQVSHLTSPAVSALLGRELPESFDVDAELSLLARPGALQTRLAVSDPRGAWLSLDGELTWPSTGAPPPELASWLERRPTPGRVSELLDRAEWRLHVDMAPRSIHQVPIPIGVTGISAAVVSARLDMTKAPSREPEGALYTEIRELTTARGAAECSSGALVAGGSVRLADGRFSGEASASDPERQLLRVGGEGRVSLLPLLRGEPPRLSDVQVTADSRRLPLAELPFMCERLEGLVSARARLRDLSGPNPRALLDVQIDGFSAGSDETVDVTAALEGDATSIRAQGKLAAAGRISTWQAQLPLARAAGKLGLDAERPLEVTLCLDRLPVGPFAAPDGPISYASGSVSGSMTARGKAASPDLDGRLTLNDVGLTVTAIAQPLSEINGELVFRDGEIQVKGLSARDAGGELAVRGSLTVRGPRSVDGVLDLVARDFPLRQGGQVVATTSAKARVSPRARENETSVSVELASFSTWLEGGKIQKGLALDPHPDLVIDGSPNTSVEQSSSRGEPSSPADADEAPLHKFSLNLQADRGFWVMRGDFSLKLRAELSMLIETRAGDAEPKLTVNGGITLDRGHLDLLGRTFDVESGGTLRFSGAPVPAVDLTAIYVDRRSDDTVRAHLSGSASSPELEFSINDEEATPAEALQAIYGSPRSSDDDDDVEGEAEVQAAQLLAALTAGILTTSIRKRFGGVAPVIAIAPSEEAGIEELRAGFELDTLIPPFLRDIVTGIYVEGSVSTEQEDDAAGKEDSQRETLIELHFPHDLVTIGRHGPGATWSLDLGWRPGPF